MANSLKRDIEVGEKVVVDKKWVVKSCHPIEKRTVIALGGFGMRAETHGRAVYVEWSDGEKSRIEGYMISKEETEAP